MMMVVCILDVPCVGLVVVVAALVVVVGCYWLFVVVCCRMDRRDYCNCTITATQCERHDMSLCSKG